jgi:hypothetical protein
MRKQRLKLFLNLTAALGMNALTCSAFADDVPEKLMTLLRSRSYDLVAPKASVAEVFLCDLYCDYLTTLSLDDKDSPTFQAKPPVEWSKLQGDLKMTWIKSAFAATDGAASGGASTMGSGGSGKTTEETTDTYISVELGALIGKRSLSTTANTDTESDAKTRPMGHFGMGFDLDELIKGKARSWGFMSEFDYDGAFSETSKNADPTRSSSFNRFDLLLGMAWRPAREVPEKKKSPWTFKLYVETQYDIFNTAPNTPLGFSSNYLMAGPGASARYKETELRISKSIFGLVQDSDDFRGTTITGGFFHVSLQSCLDLVEVSNTFLQACPNAYLMTTSVNGSGTPVQPVLTTNPSYSYTEYGIGINLRLDRLAL